MSEKYFSSCSMMWARRNLTESLRREQRGLLLARRGSNNRRKNWPAQTKKRPYGAPLKLLLLRAGKELHTVLTAKLVNTAGCIQHFLFTRIERVTL